MESIQRVLKLLPYLLLTVFVTCCESDGPATQAPNNNGQNSKTCVLKSGTSNGTSITIERNDQHLPIVIHYSNGNKPDILCSIQYDASHRVVKLIQGNASVEYTYQSGKPVVGTVYTRQTSDAVFEQYREYYYHYNTLGQLDSTRDDIGQYNRFEYDAAGNVVKQYAKQNGQPEVLTRQYITFDNNKSPRVEANFDQVPVLLDWIEGNFITMLRLPMISPHNIIKDIYVSPDAVLSHTYVYQYNLQGYPIAARILTDGQPDLSEVMEYDCW